MKPQRPDNTIREATMRHQITTTIAANLLHGEIRILIEWAVQTKIDDKPLQQILDAYLAQ